MIIIDASGIILGRLASFAAKKAMLGEQIRIINCEEAYISGSKSNVAARYKQKRERGTHTTGPFFPRYPDQIVKRTIRGMLTHKKGRGKESFARIKCFIGTPSDLEGQNPITIEDSRMAKLPNMKFVRLGDLSKNMGAKIE